jgi:hypothetical protein
MNGSRVEYDPRTSYATEFVVENSGRIRFEDTDRMVATLDGAGNAWLYSLRQAMARHVRYASGDLDGTIHLELSSVPERYFNPDLSPVDDVGLLFKGGDLLVEVYTAVREPWTLRTAAAVLGPLLKRHRAKVVTCDTDLIDDGSCFARVAIDWPTKGRTVNDASRFGHKVTALMSAMNGGELDRQSTLDLLRVGMWDVLDGQAETNWLDGKLKPYDRSKPNWQYELAKDVAAFANAPDGGLIVLGMGTKDSGDGDTITGHLAFDLSLVQRTTYRRQVAQLIYPPVRGFEVERIDGGKRGQGLVVLVIPPQRESDWPFLVHGFIKGDKVLGAHILWPVRQEDETSVMTPDALHARVRLGEQVIANERPISSNGPA